MSFIEELYEKIKTRAVLDENDYAYLEKLLKKLDENDSVCESAINNIGTFSSHKESPEINKMDVKFSEESVDIETFFKDSKLDVSKSHNTNTGKILIDGVNELIAKNVFFSYDNLSENEVLPYLKKKLKNSNITRVDENMYHSFRKTKHHITSKKKFIINERVPVIRTFAYSDLKGTLEKVDNLSGTNAFVEFFENPCEKSTKALTECIRFSLLNVKVLYYSEYLISCIVYKFLDTIGNDSSWKKLSLISLDTKMEYQQGNKLKNFRCDNILVYDDKAFIFEFKFLFGKDGELAKAAIDCIKQREYPQLVVKHLYFNNNEIFNKLKHLYGLGIGYSVMKSDLSVYVEFENFDDVLSVNGLESLKELKEAKKIEIKNNRRIKQKEAKRKYKAKKREEMKRLKKTEKENMVKDGEEDKMVGKKRK
jgi:hypothetical protein